MEYLKRLDPIWLVLVIVGGLNWGMVGLFHENVAADVFGAGTVLDVIYTIVGFAALLLLPRLMEGLHLGGQRIRPHGA